MTAHHMGTLRRSRTEAVIREISLTMPAEGIWAAVGLVAAVIAPLIFGWDGATLPAVLFLVLCPFVVAGVLIADVAPERQREDRMEGPSHAD